MMSEGILQSFKETFPKELFSDSVIQALTLGFLVLCLFLSKKTAIMSLLEMGIFISIAQVPRLFVGEAKLRQVIICTI